MKEKNGVVLNKKSPKLWLLAAALFLLFPVPFGFASDDSNFYHMSNGFLRILTAAFQIPRYLVYKTLTGPPGLGTIDGALSGTFYAVSQVSNGAFEMARGAVPYAKYAAPFLLL